MPEEYTTLEASDGIRDATEGSRSKPDKGELTGCYIVNQIENITDKLR